MWMTLGLIAASIGVPGSLAEFELQTGDRIAILGDSITEQRLYSKNIATYLAACRPELAVDVRQLGWSGESLPGFIDRMDQDCLRFKPTVATIAYGMNDAMAARPDAEIKSLFATQLGTVLDRLRAASVRAVVGGPGIITKAPEWRKSPETGDQLNQRLADLGGIAARLATERSLPFADIHGSMTALRNAAQPIHGNKMLVAGGDGVHPQAAGHLAMAQPLLVALGLGKTDLARFQVDLRRRRATASAGHEVLGFDGRTLRLRSSRYPFVPIKNESPTASEAAAATFLGFNSAVNRFILQVEGMKPRRCEVRWGDEVHTFSRESLAKGINLMEHFQGVLFEGPFRKVETRVDTLQIYETFQVKMIFRSEEFGRASDWRFSQSEQVRQGLVEAIRAAVTPVEHSIELRPTN